MTTARHHPLLLLLIGAGLLVVAAALFTPALRHLLPWREGAHPIEVGDRWYTACADYVRQAEAIRRDIGAVVQIAITAGETGANRRVASGDGQRFTCLLEVQGEQGSGIIRLYGNAHAGELGFEQIEWHFGDQTVLLSRDGRLGEAAWAERQLAAEATRFRQRLLELRQAGRYQELLEALDILQRPGNEALRQRFEADLLTLWRAEAYQALGRPRTAAEDYATYGWLHLDDPATARPALEQALLLDPNNLRAREYLEQLGER